MKTHEKVKKKQTPPREKVKSPSKTKKPVKKGDFLLWYEIPVLNLDRAMNFYSTLFEITFETANTGTHTMAFFPSRSGVNGALVLGDGCTPSQTGSLLYLNAGQNLDLALSKIDTAGGQVLMGKTLISEDIGYYSLILDSEGNRLALHSRA